MRQLIAIGMVMSLAACAGGTKLSPRERYVRALDQKLNGDAETYYDELVALAHEAPDSRAGRRARAILQSGGLLSSTALLGVVAAVAIPNFLTFREAARLGTAVPQLDELDELEGFDALESPPVPVDSETQNALPPRKSKGWRGKKRR